MSLSFVNQVGAPRGMNVAAPGTFIPEDFVRWSQDILFDRVGELRRRAPFTTVDLFNNAGTALEQPDTDKERVIGVLTTRNPNNEPRIGILVTDGSSTRVLFYDSDYRKRCFCTLDDNFRNDSIVFARPALGGGLFFGILENYGTTAGGTNKNRLYYWRGGTGEGEYAPAGSVTFDTYPYTETSGATFSESSNKITLAGHGLADNTPIVFTDLGTTTLPCGFSLNTAYFVINSAANEFQLATDVGGAAIDILEDSAGTIKFVANPGRVSYKNTIQGTFDAAKITPGMFVYRVDGSNEYYLGVVKTASNSAIELEKDIIRSFGYEGCVFGNQDNIKIKFVNIRPYIHSHGRGLITKQLTSDVITSGTIGTEGEGHFASAGITQWGLYRASDGRWLGDVDSITNNAALDLSDCFHVKDVAMNADEYIARPYGTIDRSNDSDKYTGIFNTTYAGYQWFGNGGSPGTENRIVFSSYHDPEAVDLSNDAADSIIIPGTQQMRGIATSSSGLLIFLEDKTYLLRGNYRANFSLEELYPEGCLSAQSIVEYGGGVFWASKNGILFYDGATIRNLTEANLGAYYTDSIKTFDATERRIYGFFYKDYLFMTFTGFNAAFNPKRYEPLYADTVNNSPEGLTLEQIQALDPSFTSEDFKVENNVPIYWKKRSMYTSVGTTDKNFSGFWSDGSSYADADVTSGDETITNLTLESYEIIDTSLTDDVATIELDVSDTTRFPDGKHFIKVGNVIRVDIDSGGDTTFEGDDFVVTAVTDDTVSYALVNADIPATGDAGDVIVTPGQYVVGPGIPAGATIASITDATEIEMSVQATATSYGYTAYDADPISNVPRSSVQIINDVSSTVWSKSLQFVWGEVNFIESITFGIYMPSNAISVFSNFDFRGFIKLDSVGSTRGLVGVNAVNPENLSGVYARLVDVDSMLDYNNVHTVVEDSVLTENIGKNLGLYYKGPDFYLQTKNYPVGDPVVKKWFRQLMLNLYLHDGGLRMDIVDSEDNDYIDILKKRRRNWEIFGEEGYSWDAWERIVVNTLTSPNQPTWDNLIDNILPETTWYKITDAEYTRRKKKISWRYPTVGFRLYQMNDYRPANYQNPQRPHTVKTDSWNIGFKPLRTSRA